MSAPPEAGAPARSVPVYRRAATTPRAVRELAFDRLPPVSRDRLTRGLASGAPDALLAAPSGVAPLALRAAIAATGISVVALLGLWIRGFGDPYDRLALQPAWFAAIYGALFGVAAVACGAAIALRRFQRGAPFRSGRYLFSLDLVEVEGGRLRLTSLDTLRAVEARGRQIVVRFDDGHAAVFPAARQDDPAALAELAARSVARAKELSYPADEARLQRLDPFFEVRVSDDWESCASAAAPSRSPLVWLAAAAALGATPAGLGLLHLRNALGDDAMFERARTPRAGVDVSHSLAAYSRHGRRHLDEAGRLLIESAGDDRAALDRHATLGGPVGEMADAALFEQIKGDPDELYRYLRRGGPRAAEADEALFAIVRRLDTLDGYNSYLQVGTRHTAEVRADLLPETDYRYAVRSPLIGSLFSYVRRRPGSRHEDDAWQIIRKTYAGALPAFDAAEHPPPKGLRFAEALLGALLERADPRVSLDVRMGPATEVAKADAQLGAKYGDRYLPAAGSFSEGALSFVAQDVREAVGAWFGKAFAGGVAEIARPSDDEGRPRVEIRCDPVVDGVSQWQRPAAMLGALLDAGAQSGPSHVTPLVGFFVQVKAVVQRDGKETTLAWQAHLEDNTDSKMQTRDFRGGQRARGLMLDDAFARFFEGVPARIVATFHENL